MKQRRSGSSHILMCGCLGRRSNLLVLRSWNSARGIVDRAISPNHLGAASRNRYKSCMRRRMSPWSGATKRQLGSSTDSSDSTQGIVDRAVSTNHLRAAPRNRHKSCMRCWMSIAQAIGTYSRQTHCTHMPPFPRDRRATRRTSMPLRCVGTMTSQVLVTFPAQYLDCL